MKTKNAELNVKHPDVQASEVPISVGRRCTVKMKNSELDVKNLYLQKSQIPISMGGYRTITI